MSANATAPIVLPAEWAPHGGVWIGFPSDPLLWEENYTGAQAEVLDFARAVADGGRGEPVHLICGSEAALAEARRELGEAHAIVPEFHPFFDLWLRDIGPIVLKRAGRWTAFDHPGNGWGGKYPSPLDDALAERLAHARGIPHHRGDWILEGGAIDHDGQGLFVTTEQCLLNPNRNPGLTRAEIEARLERDLGARRVLWLGEGLLNDHTDGHVDNLARVVAPGRLALPQADSDDDPNAEIYADAWTRARAFGLEPVPIPSVGRVEHDGEVVAASYMNFYIGNRAVVVPVHGAPNDDAAVAAIAALFPDHRTIGISSRYLLSGGGSFHCISQQIPAPDA